MLKILFDKLADSGGNILLLGAHSDDIEIGCGGSVLRLTEEIPDLTVQWIVLSSNVRREEEARASAKRYLDKAGNTEIEVKSFRDGFFPYSGGEIKDYFEVLKKCFAPTLIFTHTDKDAHQDHRLVNELTWNTWRDNFILEYEVPKYDGDLSRPNFFIHLPERIVDAKVALLMDCFQTQNNKHWFTEDTFRGLMRLRGMESRAPENFAEAFHCRKVVY